MTSVAVQSASATFESFLQAVGPEIFYLQSTYSTLPVYRVFLFMKVAANAIDARVCHLGCVYWVYFI